MKYDVMIIGAGAAGLMCAIEAGKRGRKVLLIDHAESVGKKIRISGGGRCNFTNLHATPANYISNNPRFCISALKRYSQHDFIELIERYNIAYHEKTLGQLFCDGSSQQVIDMLVSECKLANVVIQTNMAVRKISKDGEIFNVTVSDGSVANVSSAVIATGGPSIPKMGATDWGYNIAKQFGLNVIEPRAGLVPFTLDGKVLEGLKALSGVSLEAVVTCGKWSFREGLLFTHRGLSGPSILQISSYWKEGQEVRVNFAPDTDVLEYLKQQRDSSPKQEVFTALTKLLPKRLAQYMCDNYGYNGKLAELSNKSLQQIAQSVNQWSIIPNGTEGYRTAEVTLGGVNTDELSSKTFESKKVDGLYFIGEVVDVTGHLGGFNFQWAWASGYAAGQFV